MRKMEEEHNFMYEWRRRNNILIFRIEEYPQESYFDSLKLTEDILRMKLRVYHSSWQKFAEWGRRGWLDLFRSRRRSAARNQKSGRNKNNSTRLQRYSTGNTLTAEFILERSQTMTIYSIPSKKQIGIYDMDFLQKIYQIQNSDKSSGNPPTEKKFFTSAITTETNT